MESFPNLGHEVGGNVEYIHKIVRTVCQHLKHHIHKVRNVTVMGCLGMSVLSRFRMLLPMYLWMWNRIAHAEARSYLGHALAQLTHVNTDSFLDSPDGMTLTWRSLSDILTFIICTCVLKLTRRWPKQLGERSVTRAPWEDEVKLGRGELMLGHMLHAVEAHRTQIQIQFRLNLGHLSNQ